MSDKKILLILEIVKSILNVVICVITYYLLNSVESTHQLLVILGTVMTAYFISTGDQIRNKKL